MPQLIQAHALFCLSCFMKHNSFCSDLSVDFHPLITNHVQFIFHHLCSYQKEPVETLNMVQ